MKTILVIMIAAAAVAAHAQRPWRLQIGWGSEENASIHPDDQPDVYGPDGNVVPMTADWHAQILDAVDHTVYVDLSHEGDGLGYGFWDFHGFMDGTCFQFVTLPVAANGRLFFTRLYNHRYPALATHIADVGYHSFTWPMWDLPPLPRDYSFHRVSQSDWRVVPEPGAASLLLVGAGALVFRRMKARAAG